VVSYVSSL